MTDRSLGLTCSLIVTTSLAGYGQALAADGTGVFDQRCYSDVPAAQPNPANLNQLPVEVNADRVEATQTGKAIYSGDVQIFQGIRTLSSRYTELDQSTHDLTASGNVFYQDGQVTLRTNEALRANLKTRETRLDKAEYQLHGSPARGKAESIHLRNDEHSIEFQQAKFTTCPPGQEMWWLKASSVNVNQDEVFGEAWNASLWLYDVPVFYVPYMTFPVKDERKSGLLYPTFGFGSDDGMDLRTPYYWNIAPNYDMTLTPRYIEKRGNMLQNEFRYLPSEEHSGRLYGEYMERDRKAEEKDSSLKHRWLAHVDHTSKMADDNLRMRVLGTRVGAHDYNYFNDLSPPLSSGVDNQLMQSLTAGYYQPMWNFSGEARDYQILLPDALEPHQMLPRLNYNTYNQTHWLDTAVHSELTRFDHSSSQRKAYTGTRFHIEPVVTIPIAKTPGYRLSTEFKLMYTHYQQEVPDDMDAYYVQRGFDELADSTNRMLPSARVNGGLVFDRIGHWNNQLYTQTLEPEFQYLFVPYKDQNDIGLYDTTNMMPDYYSLFSDRRFAGLDRISDANKMSLGVTSRVFDNESVERLRLTLGQAYNFQTPKVTLLPHDEQLLNSRSLLTFEGDLHPSDPWFLKARSFYDTQQKKISIANGAVEYRKDAFMGQVNYRYVREGNVIYDAPYEQTDMSQLGLLAKVPLNRKWQAIAAYYYDTEQSRNIDRLLGLRYDSCCWSVDLVLERAYKPDNVTLTAEEETRFGLQFQMKGLGSVGSGTSYTLDTKLLPYTRPFNLND